MKRTEIKKRGTYATQWYFDVNLNKFYFRRDPNWSFGVREFNKTFHLWDYPEAEKASEVVIKHLNHVEGRISDPNLPAGVVISDGKRVVNTPVAVMDPVRAEWEAEQAA